MLGKETSKTEDTGSAPNTVSREEKKLQCQSEQLAVPFEFHLH